jgi:hypothetical protein
MTAYIKDAPYSNINLSICGEYPLSDAGELNYAVVSRNGIRLQMTEQMFDAGWNDWDGYHIGAICFGEMPLKAIPEIKTMQLMCAYAGPAYLSEEAYLLQYFSKNGEVFFLFMTVEGSELKASLYPMKTKAGVYNPIRDAVYKGTEHDYVPLAYIDSIYSEISFVRDAVEHVANWVMEYMQ